MSTTPASSDAACSQLPTDNDFLAEEVAHKKPRTLLFEDVIRILKALPVELIDLLKEYENKVAITGGFIRDIVRGDQPNDIDIAASTDTVAKDFADALARANQRASKIFVKAYTVLGYRYPIQVFKAFDDTTPSTSWTRHDFTINGASMWYTGSLWNSQCTNYFYCDVAAKRLRVLDEKQNKGNLIYRMMKLLHRGYHIEPREHAAILVNLLSDVKFEAAMAKMNGEDPIKELTKSLTSEIAAGKYEHIIIGGRFVKRQQLEEIATCGQFQQDLITGIINPPQQCAF